MYQVSNKDENKSPVKKDIENKHQKKEKNSWLGGFAKLWKPSNNVNITQ